MSQTKKEIIQMYRDWRKANGNKKPNRVIVRIIWQDDYEEGDNTTTVGTLGLYPDPWFRDTMQDDPNVLWYVGALDNLWEMMDFDNGSDFKVVEVLEFWKTR